MTRYLRDYLKYCSKCQIYQTRRHQSYESLQFILISFVSFHIVIVDFVLTLSLSSSSNSFNCFMSINCKFFKRILLMLEKNTHFVVQWKHVLLNRLNLIDWNLFKIIIFDRDRKFLFDFWIVMFTRLNMKLFYFVVYHSQTNDLFERTNQTIEISLRFLINILKHSNRWSKILSRLQRDFNNVTIVIDKSFNEISYNFTSIQFLNLFLQKIFDLSLKNNRLIIRLKTFDVIVFEQMNVKFHYDKKHQSLFIKSKNYVLIRLHKNYNILFVINKKIDQQYVESFRVIEKIERLFYRLIISNHWRIYLVFNIVQLKSCFVSFDDFFRKLKFNQSNFVFVENDIVNVKFFEIERFINKRQIKKKKSKYLMRWKKYEFEYDVWKNLSKLDDVVDFV